MGKYINDVGQWYTTLVKKIDDAMLDTAEQISIEGQEMVYTFIETRGTDREWSRAYNNRGPAPSQHKGRIASHGMHNAVERKSRKVNRNTAVASFGWLDHFEEYYGLQEIGFEHHLTGTVPGMYAMRDSSDLMMKRAEDLIGSKLRAI